MDGILIIYSFGFVVVSNKIYSKLELSTQWMSDGFEDVGL